MKKHFVSIVIYCIGIILFIFFPFLPGKYDFFVVMISFVLQIMAFVSLIFVPIGIAWLVYDLISQKYNKKNLNVTKGFAIVSLIALSIMVISGSLFISTEISSFKNSKSLGLAIFVFYFNTLTKKIYTHIKNMKFKEDENVSPISLYLIIIPLVVVLFRLTLYAPLVEYSRNKVISNS